ncbi:MAG: transposase [Cyclobacteriaceae bacterium]|nr:transposase [Cyclobacteriaceae bacterium]
MLKLLVVNQKYLQDDESSNKVLDKDHMHGIHIGYMWVYHAPEDKLVLFDFQKGRIQGGPREMLREFSGIHTARADRDRQRPGGKRHQAISHQKKELPVCRITPCRRNDRRHVFLHVHLQEEPGK